MNTYFIVSNNGIIYTNNKKEVDFIVNKKLPGGMVTHFTKEEPIIKKMETACNYSYNDKIKEAFVRLLEKMSGFEPPYMCALYPDTEGGVTSITINTQGIPLLLKDIVRDALSKIKQQYIEWEILSSDAVMEAYDTLVMNASYKTYKMDKLSDIYKYHLSTGRVVKNNKGYFIQSPMELSDFFEPTQTPFMPKTVIEDLSQLPTGNEKKSPVKDKKVGTEEAEEEFEYV